MCRCKYPKYVNKENIYIVEDKKGSRCYKVTFDLNKEGSSILVISRAPKEISKNKFDSLYKRIIKYVENNKEEFGEVKKLAVVNLFIIYEHSREDIYNECMLNHKAYLEGNKDVIYNDEIIAGAIQEADYIIAGWGEPLEGLEEVYLRRVELILKSLRYELLRCIRKKYITILAIGTSEPIG